MTESEMTETETAKYTMTERDAMEMYHEMLESCYGGVGVCGVTMSAADVLKEMDPIAYREGFWDYVNSMEDVEIVG